MTEVFCKYRPKVSVTIQGHSNAERKNGNDLCCCAVSMLSYTLMSRLKELKLKNKIIFFKDGYVHVEFAPKGVNGSKGIEAVSTVMSGFNLLMEEYPHNIKVI